MKTAVVILNYNGKKFLEKFLPGVLAHSKNAEIIVADNQSTDDSVEYLKEKFPDVKIIINDQNGGFAKGYNDALKQIKADYYVLLNSDIEVTENWIQPCIDLLEKDVTIAAVQPKILAYHDKTKFEHAGAAGGFLDKNFYPFCRGRIFEVTEEDKGQYNDECEIFWATGACLFIRSDVYHACGGFDEAFFAHMEEIDLCWRIKKRNYKIFYCGKSVIYHVGGGTLNYMHPKKTFLNFRNSLYMITKNYDGFLFSKILNRLFLDGIAGTLFFLKFQFRHFWAVLKSHFAFYAHLPQLLKQRKEIKRTTSQFNATGLYKKNIVVRKFVKGISSFGELKQSDFK